MKFGVLFRFSGVFIVDFEQVNAGWIYAWIYVFMYISLWYISVERNVCYREWELLNIHEILEQYLCLKTKSFDFMETNPLLFPKVSEKKASNSNIEGITRN